MLLLNRQPYKLEFIVFTTGACVMILELVGSRVLAPYLGTSLVVWTSLIGIILGSLSLGYWWGGRLADKNPSEQVLALIILGSAVFVGAIALIKEPLLADIQALIPDIRLGSLLATLILFCPPSVLLGTISPYAVRLKIQNIATAGATVGAFYAISTVGSIAGTFLAGFVLIAWLGNTNILFLLALTLLGTALLAAPKSIITTKKLLALALLGTGSFAIAATPKNAFGNGLVADVDTSYNRVRIVDGQDARTGRLIRMLKTDPFVIQSARFLDGDPAEPVFEYAKFYRLGDHFQPEPKRALVLGGAGYTAPRNFLNRHPSSTVDVVEIDPGLTQLARQYFALNSDKRLTIYHEDARPFLNRTAGGYDLILPDAYHSVYSIPYQLVTREAVQAMQKALTADGIVLANLITALTGEKSQFIRAAYATYADVFPHVFVFKIHPDRPATEVQNILLVALKSTNRPALVNDDPELQAYLNQLWKKPITADLPILTDDYAPVDQYVLNFHR